jgi:hypothetical protein
MQIGFLVNTANALVQIPLYTFGRLLRAVGINFPAEKIQNMQQKGDGGPQQSG